VIQRFNRCAGRVAGNGAGGAALARQLRSLIAVTGEGDERAMVRALSSIVTEYQPERLELVGPTHSSRRNGNGGGQLRSRSNGNGNGNGNGSSTPRRRGLRRPAVDDLAAETPDSPSGGGALAGGGSQP